MKPEPHRPSLLGEVKVGEGDDDFETDEEDQEVEVEILDVEIFEVVELELDFEDARETFEDVIGLVEEEEGFGDVEDELWQPFWQPLETRQCVGVEPQYLKGKEGKLKDI